MTTEQLIHTPRLWPKKLRGLPGRRLDDGRRVVASQDLAALLGCTPGNLRQLAATGKLHRETDLDEPRRSWYRIEEVARVYFTRHPGAVIDDEEVALHGRLWPGLEPGATPPSRRAEILPEILALTEAAASTEGSGSGGAQNEEGALDKDVLIARLAADLADKDEELKRLRAALAEQRSEQAPRRGQLQRRRPARE